MKLMFCFILLRIKPYQKTSAAAERIEVSQRDRRNCHHGVTAVSQAPFYLCNPQLNPVLWYSLKIKYGYLSTSRFVQTEPLNVPTNRSLLLTSVRAQSRLLSCLRHFLGPPSHLVKGTSPPHSDSLSLRCSQRLDLRTDLAHPIFWGAVEYGSGVPSPAD